MKYIYYEDFRYKSPRLAVLWLKKLRKQTKIQLSQIMIFNEKTSTKNLSLLTIINILIWKLHSRYRGQFLCLVMVWFFSFLDCWILITILPDSYFNFSLNDDKKINKSKTSKQYNNFFIEMVFYTCSEVFISKYWKL